MARIEPDEVWRLVVETGLCSRSAAAALEAQHATAPAAARDAAHAVARWLVDKGALTAWQARRIAVGDKGPFFCGPYRLLERHEHDGGAFEFTARHEPSGRIVTVVLMARRRLRDAAVRAAVERRMRIAMRATDPFLVRTTALEEADGRPFAVCEEVRGGTLADEIDRRGPPALRAAGEIALAAARAVAELHAAGEVHGGVSLDALVREPAAAGGRLRLRQFPLASDPHQVPPRALVADEAELFRLGRRAAFVAPELATGAACDPRSDVYALGCLLHALVTGRAPHWSGDARATLDLAAAAGPGPLDPAVAPLQLARLIGYLTARNPQDRYADAGEAARAIATTFGFPEPELAASPVAALPATHDPEAIRVVAVEATRRRARWLGRAGSALAAGIVAAAVALVIAKTARPPRPRSRPVDRPPAAVDVAAAAPAAPAAPTPPVEPPPPAPAPREAGPPVVNDPALPWRSPTSGAPPVLAYLPAGSQVMFVARPAALLADEEGRLFVRALGLEVAAALESVASACGVTPDQIESLEVGWQAGDADDVVVGWTARLVAGSAVPADEAARLRAWGRVAATPRAGETIHGGPGLSYWAPAAAGGRTLVAAPADRLAEIVAAAADGPPLLALPADLERLAGALDADRHLTVLGSPQYLLNRGRGLFAGVLEPLAAGFEALLGESTQAAALSIHCGDDFYVELDVVGTPDVPARTSAARLAAQVEGYPAAVRDFCAARDLHPYGRALVMELPAMVRVLEANTRAGADGKVAVVNAYLPRHAGHNIALAAELALAQADAPAGTVAAPAAATPPEGALAKLRRPMTLAFARDTLEKAIQMVSEEIGVPMEIKGTDLQLEGITQNQSFALDERDKPAAAILRVILAKANPDGKLVYVVRREGDVESLEITTRAAAQKRGDSLPPEFQQTGSTPGKGSK